MIFFSFPALEKSKTLKYEQPLTKGEAHMQSAVQVNNLWEPFAAFKKSTKKVQIWVTVLCD